MSLHKSLNRVLGCRILETPKQCPGAVISLKEPEAKMEVQIHLADQGTINIIRIEDVSHMNALNNSSRLNLKRVCDYLLIVEKDSNYYAVFVELKKSPNGLKKAREQLRRSLPIWKYILSVCEVDAEVSYDYSERYVVIYDRPRAKPRVRLDLDEGFEEYKGIQIRKFENKKVSISELIRIPR